MSARTRSALRDQRGFVLIMGVAMGSVLVIALWYLVNAGDAILVRERMQDAADAVALDTATWHARGMNAISLLNILMAVMFMVIIAIRLVELAAVVVLIACHVITLAFFPAEGGCVLLDAGALPMLVEFEILWGGRVLHAIQIAGWMQAGVAVLAPVHALTLGDDDTERHYTGDRISGVSAVSLSLLPTGIETAASFAGSGRLPAVLLGGFIGKDRTPAGRPEPSALASAFRQSMSGAVAGPIPSLPVGAGDYGTLCQRSAEMMTSELQIETIVKILLAKTFDAVVSDIPIIGKHIHLPIPDKLVDMIADADHLVQLAAGEALSTDVGKQVFCTPVLDQLEKLLEIAADKVDSGEEVLGEDQKASQKPDVDEDGKEKKSRWYKRAWGKFAGLFVDVPKQLRNLAGEVGKAAQKVKDAAGPSANDLTVAELWSYANQGDAFMHTWSAAAARSKPASASWSGTRYDAITAEAEFYANCAGYQWRTGGGQLLGSQLGGGHSCRDDLMWRLAWTARLRRYRSPGAEIRHGAFDTAMNLGDDLTGQLLDTMSAHWKEQEGNEHKDDTENPVEILKDRWNGLSPSRSISVPGIKSIRDDAIEQLRAREKHEYDDNLILH